MNRAFLSYIPPLVPLRTLFKAVSGSAPERIKTFFKFFEKGLFSDFQHFNIFRIKKAYFFYVFAVIKPYYLELLQITDFQHIKHILYPFFRLFFVN